MPGIIKRSFTDSVVDAGLPIGPAGMRLNHVQKIMKPDDSLPTFAKPVSDKRTAAHSRQRRVEKTMTSEKRDPNAQSQRKRDQEIDGRYGAIGIAAVAAAVRYQSSGKTPSPASRQSDDDWPERAA